MAQPGEHRHHHIPLPLRAAGLQQALGQLGHTLASNAQQFGGDAQRSLAALGAHAGGLVAAAQRELAARLPPPAAAQLALASLSAAAHGRRPAAAAAPAARRGPAFELAYNPEEIKMRLSGVPVFAVVNQKNEFVLVSGDDDEGRQLGLFFFAKEDAEGLIATIKEQNAKLGRAARVLTTSMDSVYEFAVAPRAKSGTEGVTFRFMPEASQVEQALELYKRAGLPATAFTGVPLFQAEGLTVKSDATRYTPLFFCKADLDSALRDAYLSKDSEAQAGARAKADRARAEVAVAEEEEEAAAAAGGEGEGRARRAAARRADAARQRLQRYEQRLEEATAKKKLPRVDVGCLEEVIVKMEQDEKGEWADVLFIPPGSLAGAQGGGAQQQPEGAKSKGK